MILGLLDSSCRDEHFDSNFIFLRTILTKLSHFKIFVTQDLSYFSIVRGPDLALVAGSGEEMVVESRVLSALRRRRFSS